MSAVSSAAFDNAFATVDRAGAQAPSLNGKMNPEKARKAAEDFEAVFISEMLKPMFEGLSTDGMFGGGPAEGIWRSMMIQEVGKSIAQKGGLGLANHIQAEMLRMQEAKS